MRSVLLATASQCQARLELIWEKHIKAIFSVVNEFKCCPCQETCVSLMKVWEISILKVRTIENRFIEGRVPQGVQLSVGGAFCVCRRISPNMLAGMIELRGRNCW